MGNLKEIFEGWKAYLVNDPVVLDIARTRAEICSRCDEAVKGSYEMIMPDYSIKEIEGLKCGKCSCPLSTATRSKDYKCPKGRW